MACGINNSAALTADGNYICFGSNYQNQLYIVKQKNRSDTQLNEDILKPAIQQIGVEKCFTFGEYINFIELNENFSVCRTNMNQHIAWGNISQFLNL